jgi:hypothetical protein
VTEAGLQDRTAAEETELLARLRAGDERAFETLVERHYPTMLAVARHYVKTRDGRRGGRPRHLARRRGGH